jgi:hypothetical protein
MPKTFHADAHAQLNMDTLRALQGALVADGAIIARAYYAAPQKERRKLEAELGKDHILRDVVDPAYRDEQWYTHWA